VLRESTDRRPQLTTTEVSEMFEVGRATLYRWIRNGKIPEPARDPVTGWPIWGQSELEAIAKATKGKRKRA